MLIPAFGKGMFEQSYAEDLSSAEPVHSLFDNITPISKTSLNVQVPSFLPLYAVLALLITLGSFLFQNKKSQITLFMLIALVILFIFGFLFYLKFTITTGDTERDAKHPIADFLESSSFKGFVQSCLDRSLIEGLDLVGKQGGFIYDYQGGIHKENKSIIVPISYEDNEKSYNVTYALLKPQRDLPNYPFYNPSFSIPFWSGVFNFYYGRFPFNNLPLPPLCENQGGNAMYLPDLRYSCLFYGPNAIQSSLKKFVANKTTQCLKNTNSFQGQEINFSMVETEIIFGEDAVIGGMNLSMQATSDSGMKETRYFVFQSRQGVRLKYLYELVENMVFLNANDLLGYTLGETEEVSLNRSCQDYAKIGASYTRDLVNPDQFVSCVKEGMHVQINPLAPAKIDAERCASYYPTNSVHCTNATLLRVYDEKSKLAGKNFSYYFVIENRPPVLDFIDESVNESFFYYQKVQVNTGYSPLQLYGQNKLDPSKNIVVNEGDTIIIIPFAKDPDADKNLIFSYQNWSNAKWESISYDPHWGILQIITTDQDSGDYTVRLIVKDQEQLYDFQDISIQVIDNP